MASEAHAKLHYTLTTVSGLVLGPTPESVEAYADQLLKRFRVQHKYTMAIFAGEYGMVIKGATQ